MSEGDMPTAIDPDEVDIANYLQAHPDFFIRHQALLAQLHLPHESGKTVSLIERQVGILRDRNVEARRRMNELLQTARDNDTLFAKTRTLTLALLESGNLQELNEVLATHVLVDFEADCVCCHLPGHGPQGNIGVDHLRWNEGGIDFHYLLSPQRASCTTLRADEMAKIFPVSAESSAGSAVLIRLHLAAGEGVLAIGSRDAARFGGDMDTLFVTYIADVLARVLKRMPAA